MRGLLSEWLTVPVPFDHSVVTKLEAFGSSQAMGARWGVDIRAAHVDALVAGIELQQIENPIRTTLRRVIHEIKATNRPLKIYCHRTTRSHFESILTAEAGSVLSPDEFLHSVSDYRDSGVFDTLIKVGPLRSWGWGSAPDAIKSAPRFRRLVQLVWAGCADESGFGYDPVSSQTIASDGDAAPIPPEEALVSRVTWSPQVLRAGQIANSALIDPPDEDEFRIFGGLNSTEAKRRAILLQIDQLHGVLYPLHANVLSFDAAVVTGPAIWRRVPNDSLREGMFIARRQLENVDLGGQQVTRDHYSTVWKTRLNEERRRNLDDLVRRLLIQGLDLASLPTAIRNWCVASTTVIHAPHKGRHFELLIKVLGVGSDASDELYPSSIPWWRRAWDEIRRSRGEAIQAGLYGQELLDDQLLITLNDLLPSIREQSATADEFTIKIPTDQHVQGVVSFHKVRHLEEGFLAPESELKLIHELSIIDQWRA
jgi:hypothetical protein